MESHQRDIEAARAILREQGDDPDQYRFSLIRALGEPTSRGAVLYRMTVQRLNGGEQSYDVYDETESWLPNFEEDLRTSRFVRTLD